MFSLPIKVCYQFPDPGGVKCWVGHGGEFEPSSRNRVHARASAFSYCASVRPKIASYSSKINIPSLFCRRIPTRPVSDGKMRRSYPMITTLKLKSALSECVPQYRKHFESMAHTLITFSLPCSRSHSLVLPHFLLQIRHSSSGAY